jgi:hypothetical protein
VIHPADVPATFVKQEVRRGSCALRTTQGAKPDGPGSGRRARSDISRERPRIDDAAGWWGPRDCQRAHRESAWGSGRLGIAFEPAPLVSRFGAAAGSRKRACTTATCAAFCSQCTGPSCGILAPPAAAPHRTLQLQREIAPAVVDDAVAVVLVCEVQSADIAFLLEGDYSSLLLGNQQPPCRSSQECLTRVVKTC